VTEKGLKRAWACFGSKKPERREETRLFFSGFPPGRPAGRLVDGPRRCRFKFGDDFCYGGLNCDVRTGILGESVWGVTLITPRHFPPFGGRLRRFKAGDFRGTKYGGPGTQPPPTGAGGGGQAFAVRRREREGRDLLRWGGGWEITEPRSLSSQMTL